MKDAKLMEKIATLEEIAQNQLLPKNKKVIIRGEKVVEVSNSEFVLKS